MKTGPLAIFALVGAIGAFGCATPDGADAGRTERLAAPPFVVHFEPVSIASGMVVLAPVSLDRTTLRKILAPSQAEEFAGLAAAMDVHLAAKACCTAAAESLSDDGAPLVYVGSATGEAAPPQALKLAEPWERYPPMVLHLDLPTEDWLARLEAQPGAAAYLWVRLALVNYPRADEGPFAKKAILGEGHEVPQSYFRTELQPLQVLQVTAVLLAPDGRVLAAGAEGIHAMDTSVTAQLSDLQKQIDSGKLPAVLAETRRDDLPGRPLKWVAALDTLVARLLEGGPQ